MRRQQDTYCDSARVRPICLFNWRLGRQAGRQAIPSIPLGAVNRNLFPAITSFTEVKSKREFFPETDKKKMVPETVVIPRDKELGKSVARCSGYRNIVRTNHSTDIAMFRLPKSLKLQKCYWAFHSVHTARDFLYY